MAYILTDISPEGVNTYQGLSTPDVKPTGQPIGSKCYETDTGDWYITTDGNTWTVYSQAGVTGITTAQALAQDESALALLFGTLATAAATGAVGTTTLLVAYIKQLVTLLLAVPTTAMRGTDNAMLATNGALEASLTAIKGAGWTTQTLVALMTAIAAIPTTAMRGTDNAALASVVGALADAAATGAVGTNKTMMAYIKQLVDTVCTSTVVDVSDTTAVADDVVAGKYFYTADGTRTLGTRAT